MDEAEAVAVSETHVNQFAAADDDDDDGLDELMRSLQEATSARELPLIDAIDNAAADEDEERPAPVCVHTRARVA